MGRKKKQNTNNSRRLNILLKNLRVNIVKQLYSSKNLKQKNLTDFKDEIKGEILKYLEANENENTTIQNLQNAAKGVLRKKFIAIQAFLKKKKPQTT